MVPFNIHVTYENQSNDFKCSIRREFLTKVTQYYNLTSDAILLFDQKTEKEISINDLSNGMSVEIKKKIRKNGQRINCNSSKKVVAATRRLVMDDGKLPKQNSTENESIKIPNLEELCTKLRNNSTLTGLERKYLLSNLTKERNKRSADTKPDMANKKIQVCVENQTPSRSIPTQTESVPDKQLLKNKLSTSKDDQNEIKRLARSSKRNPSDVSKIMFETFDVRRSLILRENPVVAQIKEKYPLLFDLNQVRLELNNIFYDGKDKEFLNNIEKHTDIILSLVDEDDELLKTVKEKITSCKSTTEQIYAKQVGALLMLSNLVNEKRLFLNTLDEPCTKDNYPRIEAPCTTDELFYNKQSFKIIVENHELCKATDFKEAMLCLIASFFIFNISYPPIAFNALVMMEKIFLEANDTNGNDIDDSTLQIIKLIQLKKNVEV